MCLHLDLIKNAVILEEFEVQARVRAKAGEASSQVSDDAKGSGLACLCK